jgi:hypothetical protein
MRLLTRWTIHSIRNGRPTEHDPPRRDRVTHGRSRSDRQARLGSRAGSVNNSTTFTKPSASVVRLIQRVPLSCRSVAPEAESSGGAGTGPDPGYFQLDRDNLRLTTSIS